MVVVAASATTTTADADLVRGTCACACPPWCDWWCPSYLSLHSAQTRKLLDVLLRTTPHLEWYLGSLATLEAHEAHMTTPHPLQYVLSRAAPNAAPHLPHAACVAKRRVRPTASSVRRAHVRVACDAASRSCTGVVLVRLGGVAVVVAVPVATSVVLGPTPGGGADMMMVVRVAARVAMPITAVCAVVVVVTTRRRRAYVEARAVGRGGKVIMTMKMGIRRFEQVTAKDARKSTGIDEDAATKQEAR